MFKAILDIIDKHPLTTLIVLLILIAAPQMLGIFALILIIPILLFIIGIFVVMWKVRKFQRKVEETLRNSQGANHSRAKHTRSEGNVTIITSEQSQGRVNDDVGEYIDFKEIKEDKK